MSALLNLTVAAFTVVALFLLVLGLLGWRRSKRPKTGILALAFAWFAVAGITTSWWLFTREDIVTLLTVHVSLTTLGLITIYFATVKR